MIARGFKSVIWVGAVGSAALGCYMVSLRVATERSDLGRVERQIVAAKRDIRSLQTELGTRGRMTQLEDWNSNVLALSAPSASQFVKDVNILAQLQTRQQSIADRSAEIRTAALDTGAAAAPETQAPAPANPAAANPAAANPAAANPAAVHPARPRIVPAIAATKPPAPHPDMVRRASFEQDDGADAIAPSAQRPAPTAAHDEAAKPAASHRDSHPARVANKDTATGLAAYDATAKPGARHHDARPVQVADSDAAAHHEASKPGGKHHDAHPLQIADNESVAHHVAAKPAAKHHDAHPARVADDDAATGPKGARGGGGTR